MHQVAPALIKVDQRKTLVQLAEGTYDIVGSALNKSILLQNTVIEELFKIEYLKYSHTCDLEESLNSVRTNWFNVPMHALIPCLEDLYVNKLGEFNKKVTGKLPKVLSAAMKNSPKQYEGIFKKIFNMTDMLIRHKNVIRLLNKPPKYLTF